MRFKVELGRLVRETRTIVVECASEEELTERLAEVYEKDDDLGVWDEDAQWGCEEGTHTVIGPDDGIGLYHTVTLKTT